MGCSGTVRPPDLAIPEVSTPTADAVRLVDMSEQALLVARRTAADAMLRQVDTDLNTFTFRFADNAATQEIDVYVPAPNATPDQWTIQLNSVSPLLGQPRPGLELAALRVGPQRVAQAVFAQWPGCVLRSMTLYSEGDILTWVAFCDTAEGVVTGSMNNQTGIFQPVSAPPAQLPVTATPQP